ncbi:hypothetical protein F5Y06DRAFT_115550 [Hypoxylon sp. FL0890]|nr:hypothetical protein F5Y06DRAFT_115550 [Hypoxylon sp. FL0890]
MSKPIPISKLRHSGATMGQFRNDHSPAGSSTRRDHGYDALLDIMAEMRDQGVQIAPIVYSLIVQLYDTANAERERSDRLISKHANLQSEYAQLVVEFNRFCKDSAEAWQKKAKQSLFDDMSRSVDSAINSSQASRDAMKRMFAEYTLMTTELAALRREVASLKQGNQTLKTQRIMTKESSRALSPATSVDSGIDDDTEHVHAVQL